MAAVESFELRRIAGLTRSSMVEAESFEAATESGPDDIAHAHGGGSVPLPVLAKKEDNTTKMTSV